MNDVNAGLDQRSCPQTDLCVDAPCNVSSDARKPCRVDDCIGVHPRVLTLVHRAIRLLALCPLAMAGAMSGFVAHAAEGSPAADVSADLAADRDRFMTARDALAANDQKTFREVLPTLVDYPLHDWLVYRELVDRWKRETPLPGTLDALSKLKAATTDPVLLLRAGRALQTSLAQGEEWARYLAIEKSEYGVEMPCTTLRARTEMGQTIGVEEATLALWVKPSEPDEICADVVAKRVANAPPPIATIWERVYEAMDANVYDAAREVLPWLGTADRKALTGWIEAVEAPGDYIASGALQADTPFNRRAIADLVLRWSREDTVAAVEWWERESPRYRFYKDRFYDTHRALVMRASLRRMPEAGEWLSNFKARDEDLEIKEWRVRAALLQGDWTEVMRYLYRLPVEEREEDHWAYWEARALEVAGQQDLADGIYRDIASLQSWHGFLAADRLGLDYVIVDEPIEPDPVILEHMSADLRLLRAREFYAVGMEDESRRVWNTVVASASKPELAASAVLAKRWGLDDRAIFSAGRAEERRALSYRFPILYRSEVAAAASEHRIEPAWIFGVMRRESAFIPNVVSHAGAVGLMQLMPRTASYVADLQKVANFTGDLTDTDLNIDFGTFYLGHVRKRFDGHRALATASYNAGPNRVSSWLPDDTMEADRWIDTIPFTETRRYVRAVLAYAAIYEHQLTGTVTRISDQLPPVEAVGSDPGKSL